MARQARFEVPGVPHLVIRGGQGDHSTAPSDRRYAEYESALAEVLGDRAVAVDAYAFVGTQALFLITPSASGGLARFVQRLSRKVRPSDGVRLEGCKGRFRSVALEPERFLLDAVRYVEQASLRAGAVDRAVDWRWSSAGARCGIRPMPSWLATHALLFAGGNTPFDRERAHRLHVETPLATDQIERFEQAARAGWPLGSPTFLSGVQERIGRAVAPRPRGRPAVESVTI